MKTVNTQEIHMTDALERELLREAIDAQYSYPLDRAIKRAFQRIVAFFSSSRHSVPHSVSTAH